MYWWMVNSVNPDQSAPLEAEIDLGLHYLLRCICKALPVVLWNRGKQAFISREQGNKRPNFEGNNIED